MKQLQKVLFIAAFAVALFVGSADAQLINYVKSGTGTTGFIIPVFNAIDSLIADGTIVSIDTTLASGTNLKRIVVRPYAGTSITRAKCVGVSVGSIARSSRGGVGNVLVWGYHANAKMNASGLTANIPLKVSPATHGAFGTGVDSLSGQIGVFFGYNANSTVANSRGKVFITNFIGRFFGSL
mgnify:CR=1 FL=1